MTYKCDCTYSLFLLSLKCFVVQWHRVKHVSMSLIMAEVILHYLDFNFFYQNKLDDICVIFYA